MAKLVLNLVPQLDVPGQVLVGDQDAADGAGLFGHQGVFAGIPSQCSKILTC